MSGRDDRGRRSSFRQRTRSPVAGPAAGAPASETVDVETLAFPRARGERRPDEPGAVYVGVSESAITVLIIMGGVARDPARFFMGSRPLGACEMLGGLVEMRELPGMPPMLRGSATAGFRPTLTRSEPSGGGSSGAE